MSYVETITQEGSSDFIPVADRIAVFDNDGTLWPEQPIPNQLQYVLDYIKENYAAQPEWVKIPALKAAYEGDFAAIKKSGMAGLMQMLNAASTSMTETAYTASIEAWLAKTRDAKFDKPYQEVVYLPMVQLLEYLRENEFKTFIVSGGGADFMRPWTEKAYGIPPYHVIGSYGEASYEVLDGKTVITKTAGEIYVDDKAGKPVAIHRFIGKVPVICGGNSDGDQAMMQYTSGSKYKSLCLILHHTDSIREFAYDTVTVSGHLETALIEAEEKNWLVVDMEKDFKKIFAFE